MAVEFNGPALIFYQFCAMKNLVNQESNFNFNVILVFAKCHVDFLQNIQMVTMWFCHLSSLVAIYPTASYKFSSISNLIKMFIHTPSSEVFEEVHRYANFIALFKST